MDLSSDDQVGEASRSTIRDVARLAGVSLGTISNYLSGRKPVSDATRRRIDAAVADLRFVPNSAVRVMRGGRTHAIAMIVPDGTNAFFADVSRAIEDVAVSEEHVVMMCNTEGDADRERQYARVLSEMRVRGAIAIASGASDDTLHRIRESGGVVVVLGTGDPDIHSVSTDDALGGYLALKHLLDLGHRDIAFLGGPGAIPQIRDRIAGAAKAIGEADGLPTRFRKVAAGGNSAISRLDAAERILTLVPVPSAVFCANDELAVSMQTAAIRQGLRVPEDLAIIGYDDTDEAAAAPVPLSTVSQPKYDLGDAAARLLFSSTPASEVQHITFEPSLVVRASTRQ